MKLPWLLTNNVENKNPNFRVFLPPFSCKKRDSYTYSHLLILRSDKTALTYLRPSHQCFQCFRPASLTKLNGGLSWLHSADEDTVSWLTNYGS